MVSNVYQGHLTVKSEESVRKVAWLPSDLDTQVSFQETSSRETPVFVSLCADVRRLKASWVKKLGMLSDTLG